MARSPQTVRQTARRPLPARADGRSRDAGVSGATAATQGTADSTTDSAAIAGVEMMRNAVSASLSASQGLLRFLDQVHQLNAQTLQDLSASLNAAMADARRASDLQELLTLQADWASTQVARTAQNCGDFVARWLDAETQFIEQAQDEAARVSHRVLGAGTATLPQPAVLTPGDATPLAMLGDAQNAMTEMTRQWVEMVKGLAATAQRPRA